MGHNPGSQFTNTPFNVKCVWVLAPTPPYSQFNSVMPKRTRSSSYVVPKVSLYKPVYKKQKPKSGKSYSAYKSINSRPLVVSRNLKTNRYFPESLVTTVSLTMPWYIPAGNSTLAHGSYTNVMVNSIAAPFNQSYPIGAGGTYGWNGITFQGSAVTDNFVGIEQIKPLYNNCIIESYVLECSFQPTSVADPFRVVVVPLGQEQIPSAGAGYVGLKTFESQPGAKAKTIMTGTSVDSNTITIRGKCSQDLGQTWGQYNSQFSSLTAAPSSTVFRDYAGIFLQMMNGQANITALSGSFRLSVVVRFTDLVNPLV